MKKFKSLLGVSLMIMITIVLFSGCKKDEEKQAPAFTVNATIVPLQGGGDGLQFFAKCTNVDVKMTKVQMLDPGSSPLYEYDLKGASYSSGELFGLQAEGEAYLKQVGTWQFTFIGNRTDDNASFTATYSLVVAK